MGDVLKSAAIKIWIMGAWMLARINTVGQMGGVERQNMACSTKYKLCNKSFSRVWQGDKVTGLFCHLSFQVGPGHAGPIKSKHLSPTV